MRRRETRARPPISTDGAEEALAEVAVAEAVQRVLPAQDRLEQPQVRGCGRVGRALRAPVGVPDGMGESTEGLIGMLVEDIPALRAAPAAQRP